MERLDVLVIGPGLGRHPQVFQKVKEIITLAKDARLPLVLDGDALFLLAQIPTLIHGYPNAVLTPNAMEYARLCHATTLCDRIDVALAKTIAPQQLAHTLGNVCVLQKGAQDRISNGIHTIEVNEPCGAPRRCGGQGDVLAGCLGTFLAWSRKAPDTTLDTGVPCSMLACYGASSVVRGR